MYVKGFIQLTTFFIFLGIFTATVLASQSIEQSQLASHVTQLFTVGGPDSYPLKNVRSIDDYWKFIETTFLPAVFADPDEGDIALALDMNNMLLPIDLNNRILGSMLLWQVRVKRKNSCQVGQLFANYETNCFQPLLDYTHDQDPYGPTPIVRRRQKEQGSSRKKRRAKKRNSFRNWKGFTSTAKNFKVPWTMLEYLERIRGRATSSLSLRTLRPRPSRSRS